MVCPKSIRPYFYPEVNNGESVGKLSVVVEGTIMRMHDLHAGVCQQGS
jgi:hypothetical protein